jgi:predicted porin
MLLGMLDHIATPDLARRFRRRSAFAMAGAAYALLGLAAASGPASAGPKEQPAVEDDHYQVYIGDPSRSYGAGGDPYLLEREWGSIRLTDPSAPPVAGGMRGLSAMDGGSAAGVTYFTPSLSGMRVGVGMSGAPREAQADTGGAAPYSALGPRVPAPRDASGNWQVGGKVGYSGLEIGANVGDHPDPTCEAGAACKTNDFWDIGVALRIGSGALSAAYTASQPRALRPDEADRIDVFSLNAGYKLTPGMNIYGGVDWVDPHNSGEASETPVDTRFMFGTNLRF